jgi:tetratricopeptide (TPR) repeat protein
MPKRVTQHEIEDISRAKFMLELPRKWVFRDKSKDYGIDGEVELFNEDKSPQGLVFWVQLKATESKSDNKILNIDFNIETLKYYKTLDIPVLLVRYSDYDSSIYIKWIHNVDLFLAKKDAKTLRLKMSKLDKWNESSSDSIESYLKNVRLIKSGKFGFPIHTSISICEARINDISKEMLFTQIKKELNNYAEFVIPANIEKSLVYINLKKEELKINVSDLGGCSIHSIELREKEGFAQGIAKDILLGISVSLVQLGHIEYAGRLIFENSLENRLLEKLDLLMYCLAPLLNSTFFNKTLNLIGNILDDEQFIEIGVITQINLLLGSNTGNTKKTKAIEGFLKTRIDNATKRKNKQEIGISHYNIGNYFSTKHEFEKSIHHYNLARKFAPIYLKQHYFFAEIASILFRSEKYFMASKLYSKSLEIKKDNHTIGLYADSLMFNGQYKNALENFEIYINNSEKPNDEFVLKSIWLHEIINKHKIDFQKRDTQKVKEYIEIVSAKDGNPTPQIEKGLEVDLLSGVIWFNLGMMHNNNNNQESAFFCFIFAALINNGDIEAWTNGTLLAFNSKEASKYMPLIIRTAYFFNREEYIEDLYFNLEKQGQSEPLSQLMSWIENLLADNENGQNFPTVRMLNEDGRFINVEK